jgi:hypothetical protein
MKQKDLALILVIIFVSVVVSLFISNEIIVPSKNRQQEVDVVQPITTNFPKADSRYFNSTSIDPTQIIVIGQNSNTNPFNSPTEQ